MHARKAVTALYHCRDMCLAGCRVTLSRVLGIHFCLPEKCFPAMLLLRMKFRPALQTKRESVLPGKAQRPLTGKTFWIRLRVVPSNERHLVGWPAGTGDRVDYWTGWVGSAADSFSATTTPPSGLQACSPLVWCSRLHSGGPQP